MSLLVLYFLHSTSVLSFYIDVVLTLSIGNLCQKNITPNKRAILFQKHMALVISGSLLLTLWGRYKWPIFSRRHFQMNFLERNESISIKISLTFVPKGQINNIPALVYIMAWRRPGSKPLSEPKMETLLTHTCVTRPQWVNRDELNPW